MTAIKKEVLSFLKKLKKNNNREWFEVNKPDFKRIEAEGPLGSKDFEDTRENKTGWWDWKPAKKAIEVLYLEGDLMISSRKNFQKTYDLIYICNKVISHV